MRSLKPTLLDWYIIRKFIGTYFFAIALILAVCVVFDFAEKVDDFMETDAPLKAIVFDYYLNFIPYFGNLFSSLFVFVTVIFITSKMANQSEIIAIFSSGVSFKRLLYPYFLSSLAIFLLSVALSNFIIPPANSTRVQFENTYISRPRYKDQENVHKQVRPGIFVYIQSYNPNTQTAHKVSLEHFEGKELLSKTRADMVRWDSVVGKWRMTKYYTRYYRAGQPDSLVSGLELDTTLYLLPKDLARTNKDVQTMDLWALNRYIEEQELQGAADINASYIEKYGRVATPFSTFILTLIGVAVSSRKVRGGMGKNLGFGLGLSFTYILLQRFATMFSLLGGLPPLLAVWIPNFIFAGVAVYIYRRAPK
ncbi:MAG: hypothetical protein CSA97_03755 [Bacteroidetes bacterium]|nr:MAG: hypothetical protein CSA97_03755 [Bacteroidota bacterium]